MTASRRAVRVFGFGRLPPAGANGGLSAATGVKTFIRLIVALFAAVFGSLLASVLVCTFAAHRSAWPKWADLVCGHNVGLFWLMTAPLLFALVVFLLGRHFTPFRRPLAVLLLAVYGLYGLYASLGIHGWRTALLPAATLVAAIGVAGRTRWAPYLVYAVALVFAAIWVYYVWLAAVSGHFRNSGVGVAILSLLPGVAFLLLGAFCCYAATVDRVPQSGPGPSSPARS
jgi:hypothetical protein